MSFFILLVFCFSVIGPIILTLMGAILATRSLEPKRKQWGWRIAFFAVGSFTVIAGLYSLYTAQTIASGANFFYFVPTIVSTTEFQLTALNPSNLAVYDVYLYIRNAESEEPAPPGAREIGTIPPGVKQINLRLPFGYYQIDIRSRYNVHKYIEMLKVMPFRGQIGQSYSVSEVGKGFLQKYTSPNDFPGTYPTESARTQMPPSDRISQPQPPHWPRPRQWLRSIFTH
jgi:hypothetical protein